MVDIGIALCRGGILENHRKIAVLEKEADKLTIRIRSECQHPTVIVCREGAGFGYSIPKRGVCPTCTLEEEGEFTKLSTATVIKEFSCEEVRRYEKFLKFLPESEIQALINEQEMVNA